MTVSAVGNPSTNLDKKSDDSPKVHMPTPPFLDKLSLGRYQPIPALTLGKADDLSEAKTSAAAASLLSDQKKAPGQ